MSASIAPASSSETYRIKPFDLHSKTATSPPAQAYSQDGSVPQLVAAQAAAKPDAPAVADGDEILSYRELEEQANQLAHQLIALGVERETIVGICLNRSAQSVICALAVLKAGGAYLPLDPAYPIERIAFMLNEAQPRVLITEQKMAAQLAAGSWQVVTID